MKRINLNLIFVALLCLSCQQKEEFHGYDAVFSVTSEDSKTAILEGGRKIVWENNDVVALWAKSKYGYTFFGREFHIFASGSDKAFFTSQLASPMEDGTYRYRAAHPSPVQSLGSSAYFDIPKVQDGSGREAILMSGEVSAGPLRSLRDESVEPLNLTLDPKTHLLRFYLNASDAAILQGEGIKVIDAEFPKSVVGRMVFDMSEADFLPSLENGLENLRVELPGTLALSESSERQYAYASIYPVEFRNESELNIKLYSTDKVFLCDPIPLKGRIMEAGHATAVRLRPVKVKERGTMRFSFNCLWGENIQSVLFAAPEGCDWDNGQNYRIYYPENTSGPKEFVFDFEDIEAYRSLSGKTVNVTFESAHAYTTRQITMPDLYSVSECSFDFPLGYLLFENFDTVGSFSSHDAAAKPEFDSGSQDAISFLDGWSMARCGAEAGKCVRIAPRRETSADYPARMDTRPLSACLKAGAKVLLEFDYGAAETHSGLGGKARPQTCKIGYVTSTDAFKSGDGDGVFLDDNYCITTSMTNGSYDNTPSHARYEFTFENDIPLLRFSFVSQVEHALGANNNVNYLYFDNFKVTLINE